jgi:hypothetical protein
MKTVAPVVPRRRDDQHIPALTKIDRLGEQRQRLARLSKLSTAYVDDMRPLGYCKHNCSSQIELGAAQSAVAEYRDDQSAASRSYPLDTTAALSKNDAGNMSPVSGCVAITGIPVHQRL